VTSRGRCWGQSFDNSTARVFLPAFCAFAAKTYDVSRAPRDRGQTLGEEGTSLICVTHFANISDVPFLRQPKTLPGHKNSPPWLRRGRRSKQGSTRHRQRTRRPHKPPWTSGKRRSTWRGALKRRPTLLRLPPGTARPTPLGPRSKESSPLPTRLGNRRSKPTGLHTAPPWIPPWQPGTRLSKRRKDPSKVPLARPQPPGTMVNRQPGMRTCRRSAETRLVPRARGTTPRPTPASPMNPQRRRPPILRPPRACRRTRSRRQLLPTVQPQEPRQARRQRPRRPLPHRNQTRRTNGGPRQAPPHRERRWVNRPRNRAAGSIRYAAA
jgi:hypothetical protein